MSSALSIRQLTKTYGNGFQALSGIDLDVAEGDFFALLGPNGAGKSTTIGILSTLVNKTSGSVNIFGHDLDKSPAALKRSIGVVPQEFNFNQFEKTFDIVVTQAGYYGIPAKIGQFQILEQTSAVGMRICAHSPFALGVQPREVAARCTGKIEELVGAIAFQPRLQEREVFEIATGVGDRYLV